MSLGRRLERGVRKGREALRVTGAAALEGITTGLVFNPVAPKHLRDPYVTYRRLRARDPIHRSYAAYGWFVSRHADCLSVLKDPRYSADDRNFALWKKMRKYATRDGIVDPTEPVEPTMLRSDPPDHTRLRGLVSKAFTPRMVEKLRPRIEAITAELLDDLGRRSGFDLIADLAVPLPIIVIAEMLGVPADDRAIFKLWSDRLVGFLDPAASPGPEILRRTREELMAYVSKIADARRARPEDDLISALVLAEEAGDHLNGRELFGTVALLLAAGNETTTNLIGNGVLALLDHGRAWEQLGAEPGRIETAVEELLRWDPPVQFTGRVASEDMDLQGTRIRKGQNVILMLAGANRDPAAFDRPEELDITRADNRHLSFGYGIHHCLGAPLARLEARIGIGELARRMPDLRLSVPRESIRWRRFTFLRGADALPVQAGSG